MYRTDLLLFQKLPLNLTFLKVQRLGQNRGIGKI